MTLIMYLEKLIGRLTGNVITIGIHEKTLLEAIEKNKKMNQCYILNSTTEEERRRARWSLRKNANVPISKFRRTFKKKKVDTIICNMAEISPFLHRFIKDSVYICRGRIYYYATSRKQLNSEFLKKKYRRYRVRIEEEEFSNGYVLVVTVKNAKTYRIKEWYYSVLDIFTSISDAISDYLVN